MNQVNVQKIVLLEDEPAHAEAIIRAFEYSGEYEIIHLSTLAQFKSYIIQENADLVITDLNLPDGDAFSILNQEFHNHAYPMLLMTSFGNEEIAVQAIKSGAFDYMVKSEHSFIELPRISGRILREWSLMQQSKEAQNALRISEERFRLVLDATSDIIWDWDMRVDYLYLSNLFYKTLGYNSDEFVHTFDHFMSLVHEGDVDLLTDTLKHHLNGSLSEFKMEFRIRKANSTFLWVSMRGKIVDRNDKKTPIRLVGSLQDISERMIFEEELIRAKIKAEESDKLKSAFLANISHEIRTPMNGILGFSQLLASNTYASAARQEEYIQLILDSSEQLLRIVSDILDISKIESNQIEIITETIDLRNLMRELVSIYSVKAAGKKLEFFLKEGYISSDNLVYIDSARIKQILGNLIDNAIKFTLHGSIEVSYFVMNKQLEFHISDTGIGISEENLPFIFDRFRQVELSFTRHFGGTGLGLSIAKALTEIIGGSIQVNSKLNKGSTFIIRIPFRPVSQSNTSPIASEDSTDIVCLEDCVILIVEDEHINYLYINEILIGLNITTLHATNGYDAIMLAKERKDIKLILMDMKMPKLNGIETTIEIRKFDSKIPIVAQTAYAFEQDRKYALENGCNDFITKPISRELLVSVIRKYI